MKRIESLQNIDELIGFMQQHMTCEHCPIYKKCKDAGNRGCYNLLKEYFEEEEKSPADLEFERLGYVKVQGRSGLYTKDQLFFIQVFDFDEAVEAYMMIDGEMEPSSIRPKEYRAAMLKIEELKGKKRDNELNTSDIINSRILARHRKTAAEK